MKRKLANYIAGIFIFILAMFFLAFIIVGIMSINHPELSQGQPLIGRQGKSLIGGDK